MSSPHSRQCRSPSSSGEGEPPSMERKAVLFCPDCGHEDPVDGDWVERDDRTDRVRELHCPECAAVVTGRPLPTDSEASRPRDGRGPGERAATWGSLWVSTVRFWVDAFGPGRRAQRAN